MFLCVCVIYDRIYVGPRSIQFCASTFVAIYESYVSSLSFFHLTTMKPSQSPLSTGKSYKSRTQNPSFWPNSPSSLDTPTVKPLQHLHLTRHRSVNHEASTTVIPLTSHDCDLGEMDRSTKPVQNHSRRIAGNPDKTTIVAPLEISLAAATRNWQPSLRLLATPPLPWNRRTRTVSSPLNPGDASSGKFVGNRRTLQTRHGHQWKINEEDKSSSIH